MRNRVVIQQALVAMFFALIVVGSAQEGQAITPSAGDALILRAYSLTHVDSATGVETIVTCSDLTDCSSLVGFGPAVANVIGDQSPQVGIDGWIYVVGAEPNSNDLGVYRINPGDGSRELAWDISDNDMGFVGGMSIYPSSSYFPPSVATLTPTNQTITVFLLGMIASALIMRGRTVKEV